jgi:transcriptional regulator with XRE-family HTH domain
MAELATVVKSKTELPGGTPEDKKLTWRLFSIVKKIQTIERDIYILSGVHGEPIGYVPSPIPQQKPQEDDAVYIYHKGKRIGVLSPDALTQGIVAPQQPKPAVAPVEHRTFRQMHRSKRANPSVLDNAWKHRNDMIAKWNKGLSQTDIGKEYGVSNSTVGRIIRGETDSGVIIDSADKGPAVKPTEQRPAYNKPISPYASQEAKELYDIVVRIKAKYGIYQQDIAKDLGTDAVAFSKAIHGHEKNQKVTKATLLELEKKYRVDFDRKEAANREKEAVQKILSDRKNAGAMVNQ